MIGVTSVELQFIIFMPEQMGFLGGADGEALGLDSSVLFHEALHTPHASRRFPCQNDKYNSQVPFQE